MYSGYNSSEYFSNHWIQRMETYLGLKIHQGKRDGFKYEYSFLLKIIKIKANSMRPAHNYNIDCNSVYGLHASLKISTNNKLWREARTDSNQVKEGIHTQGGVQ